MPLVMSWEVAGDVQLRRAFPALAVEMTDLREPLKRVGERVIYPATRHQFASEGDPAWPALSPAYARRKAAKVPGAKILHYTGALEESLTDQSDSSALYRLEKMELEIGSQLMVGQYNLALIHYAPKNSPLPARKMMRLGPDDQTEFVRVFEDWLEEEMKRQGILI